MISQVPEDDPYARIQQATRDHRAGHGCGAYTFSDGRLLLALARQLRPDRVLELGTALGYTACCWADGGAAVDTLEGDPSHVRLARENVEAAGLAERVTVRQGDFDDLLPGLPGPYDAVFFDGFAPSPPLLGELGRRLSPGGLLVTANLRLAGRELRRHLDGLPARETRFVGDDVAVLRFP